jgi:hypothetical protein
MGPDCVGNWGPGRCPSAHGGVIHSPPLKNLRLLARGRRGRFRGADVCLQFSLLPDEGGELRIVGVELVPADIDTPRLPDCAPGRHFFTFDRRAS